MATLTFGNGIYAPKMETSRTIINTIEIRCETIDSSGSKQPQPIGEKRKFKANDAEDGRKKKKAKIETKVANEDEKKKKIDFRREEGTYSNKFIYNEIMKKMNFLTLKITNLERRVLDSSKK